MEHEEMSFQEAANRLGYGSITKDIIDPSAVERVPLLLGAARERKVEIEEILEEFGLCHEGGVVQILLTEEELDDIHGDASEEAEVEAPPVATLTAAELGVAVTSGGTKTEKEKAAPVEDQFIGEPPSEEPPSGGPPSEEPSSEEPSSATRGRLGSSPYTPTARPTGRYHFTHLRCHQGVFLVRYDQEMNIVGAFGGAVRFRQQDRDVLLVMTPQRLCEGALQGRMPNPDVVVLRGQDGRRDRRVTFEEVPDFTRLIQSRVGPGYWGVLSYYPNPNRCRIGTRWNGENSERHLNPNNWDLADGENSVPFGGGPYLRLSPQAVEVAGKIPTAWEMMVVSGVLFGGIDPKYVPYVRLDGSASLAELVDHEKGIRESRRRRPRLYDQGGDAVRSRRDAVGSRVDPALFQRAEEMVKRAADRAAAPDQQ